MILVDVLFVFEYDLLAAEIYPDSDSNPLVNTYVIGAEKNGYSRTVPLRESILKIDRLVHDYSQPLYTKCLRSSKNTDENTYYIALYLC